MRVPPWNLDLEWTFLESFYLHVIRDTIVLPLYWSQEFHNHRSYSCPTSRLFYLSLRNTKMWYYNIALSTKPHTTITQYACWWMQTEYEKRKQVSSNFNFFTLSERKAIECILPLLRNRNLTEVSLYFYQYGLYCSPLAVSYKWSEKLGLRKCKASVKISSNHILWNIYL